jgi:putative thioredoxin
VISLSNDKDEEKLMKKKLEEMKKRFILKEDKAKNFEIEIEVSDENFQEKVIEMSKKVPVLVDFYGDWCGPCKMLSPTLEKIARDYDRRFVLAKVNVDKAQITAGEFGIMSVPTVILFKNGEPVDYFVGALPEPQIRDWLKRRL